MKRKLLSALLVFAMVLTMLPVNALAAEAPTGADIAGLMVGETAAKKTESEKTGDTAENAIEYTVELPNASMTEQTVKFNVATNDVTVTYVNQQDKGEIESGGTSATHEGSTEVSISTVNLSASSALWIKVVNEAADSATKYYKLTGVATYSVTLTGTNATWYSDETCEQTAESINVVGTADPAATVYAKAEDGYALRKEIKITNDAEDKVKGEITAYNEDTGVATIKVTTAALEEDSKALTLTAESTDASLAVSDGVAGDSPTITLPENMAEIVGADTYAEAPTIACTIPFNADGSTIGTVTIKANDEKAKVKAVKNPSSQDSLTEDGTGQTDTSIKSVIVTSGSPVTIGVKVKSESGIEKYYKVTITMEPASTVADITTVKVTGAETEDITPENTSTDPAAPEELSANFAYAADGKSSAEVTLTLKDTVSSEAWYSLKEPAEGWASGFEKYGSKITVTEAVKHDAPQYVWIKVIAQDKSTTNYYKLTLTMTAPSQDATLKEVKAEEKEGATVEPATLPEGSATYDENTPTITVTIPYENSGSASNVKINISATDKNAKVAAKEKAAGSEEILDDITSAGSITLTGPVTPDEAVTIGVKVTPEDPTENLVRYYKVNVIMEKGKTEALLTAISVDNAEGVTEAIKAQPDLENADGTGEDATSNPITLNATVPYANKEQKVVVKYTASDKATVTTGTTAGSVDTAVTKPGEIEIASLTDNYNLYIKVVSEDQTATTYYKLTIKLDEPDTLAAITAINIAGYDAKAKEESVGDGGQTFPYEWTVSMPEDTTLTSAAVKVTADKANANKVAYKVAESWSEGTDLSRDETDKTLWTGSVSDTLNFEANKTIFFAITAQDESTAKYYKVTLEKAPVEIETMESPKVDTTYTNLKTELEKINNDSVKKLDSAVTAAANDVIKAAAEGKGSYSEDNLKAKLEVESAAEVYYYVVPSLEIEVIDYATTGGAEKFILDVTPTYEVIASDKDTYAEVKNGKSFVVDSGPLQPEEGTPAEITIPIPMEYLSVSGSAKLYVRLEGETGFTEYELTDQNLKVKFPHFSQVEIKKTAGIAKMGEVYYDTLREAVEDATKTDNFDVTITLYAKPNVEDVITVSKAGTITLKDDGSKYAAEDDAEALKGVLVPDTSKLEAFAEGNPVGGDDMTGTGLKFTFTAKSTPEPGPVGPGPQGGSTGSGGGSSATVSSASAINGSFSISDKNAKAGDTVKVTPKADEGYTVDAVKVTDKNGKDVPVTQNADGTYSFVMPDKAAQPVKVDVTFKEEEPAPATGFVDVADTDYFADAVAWAVENGITDGVGNNLFAPQSSCTRAQIVTFLWRAAGSPEPVNSGNPFADVNTNDYYGKAVLWAVEQGITNGTSATEFSPNVTCTRAQAVTFLHRYEKQPAAADSSFADVAAGAYYEGAVDWAVANEITNGTGNNLFAPDATCTRAQIVTFLYRDMVK